MHLPVSRARYETMRQALELKLHPQVIGLVTAEPEKTFQDMIKSLGAGVESYTSEDGDRIITMRNGNKIHILQA